MTETPATPTASTPMEAALERRNASMERARQALRDLAEAVAAAGRANVVYVNEWTKKVESTDRLIDEQGRPLVEAYQPLSWGQVTSDLAQAQVLHGQFINVALGEDTVDGGGVLSDLIQERRRAERERKVEAEEAEADRLLKANPALVRAIRKAGAGQPSTSPGRQPTRAELDAWLAEHGG